MVQGVECNLNCASQRGQVEGNLNGATGRVKGNLNGVIEWWKSKGTEGNGNRANHVEES